MKKILLFASALAGLFLAGSCQKENFESAGNTVTFTVEAPGAIATKTIADGLNVDEVHYAVYKTHSGVDYSIDDSGAIDGPLAQGVVPMENKRASIDFDLLQDQEFTVIFWAQVKDAGHYDLGDLRTIKVATSVMGNDETRAAFYARYDFSTYEHKDHVVTLKRPFAQLNLLTTAESLTPVQTGQTQGYTIDVKKSEVVVAGLADTFNTLTGLAPEGEAKFVFQMADTPEEQGQETLVVNGKAYHYVSMNYFFVPQDEKLVDIKYTVSTDKGDIKNEIVSVPVKENYRTNVIGNLLTKESTFEIVVDADFDGQELVEVWDQREVSEPAKNAEGQYVISTASELAWLSAAVNGTLPVVETRATEVPEKKTFAGETFVLLEDIDLENVAWNPIGNVKGSNKEQYTWNFKGTFDGNGHVIKNLKVNNANVAGLFGYMTQGTVKNLTIEGFELDAEHYAGAIVGWNEGSKTVIENCTVLKGDIELSVKNGDYGDKAGAIVGFAHGGTYSNNTAAEVTIKGYRDLGGVTGNLQSDGKLLNNKVSAVTIIADQTVEYAEVKDVNAGEIVGRINSDKVQIEGNKYDNVTVIRKVDSTEELAYAVAEAQNGDTIYVGGEVTMPYFSDKALNFEGITKSAIVKQSPATHIDDFYAGAELNFKGLTLVGTKYLNNTQGYQKAVKETYTECNFQDYIMFAGDETIVNKCNFTSNVGQYFWTGTADAITFNDCKFNVLERAIKVCTVGNNGERTVTLNNCQFKAATQVKAAIEIDGTQGTSYIVNINGCTNTGFAAGEFTNDTLFNVEGAENVTVYVDGKKWDSTGIFVGEDGTKYYSNTTGLNTALAAAQAGDVINLLPGEFAPTSYKAGVKLVGTSAEEVKVNVEGKQFGLGGGEVYIENVTLKFANAEYTGFQHTGDETYKNCVIEGQPFLYGNNVTFESCTFKQTSSDKYNVWTYGAKNVKFNTCKFYSAGKSVLVYHEDKNLESKVTFNGCELYASVPVEGKAAIEIDGSLVKKYVVNINDTKANGFAAGSVSKSTLWNIKKGADKAEVYVNNARMIADGVALNAAGEYELNAANGLFWFAEQVNVANNKFSGKTVKLAANIDLKNAAWTPVGQTGATTFNGVFDGQEYTISNLNVNSEAQKGANYSSGLFGWVESHTAGHGHIKNVKISGATVTGHHNCGALVGYITQQTALVENCHVTGATITCTKANNDADGDKAGALIGNATVATPVKDCTAANSTVSAGRDAGQVIGAGKEANVTGCSATNVTVSANGTSTGANVRNEVIGRLL